MSSAQKYIQGTLTLPSQLPLFNYNINFEGLRKILQGVNIKTNNNESDIIAINQKLDTKLNINNFNQLQKKLGGCYLFGVRSQSYIDGMEQKNYKNNKVNLRQLGELDQFCWKMNKMAEILEVVYSKVEQHDRTILNNGKQYQKLIDESFRRIDDKVNSNLQSFTKTINSFFSQTNDKITQSQSSLNTLKFNIQGKISDLGTQISKRVTQNSLKSSIESSELKVKKQLQGLLKNDQMQRLSTVNELKNAFKESEKDLQLKSKAMFMRLNQFSEKVTKALLITNFEIEKHKIYEKLSQLKNKTDDLGRKNSQFIEFRKKNMEHNEKIKQDIIGLNEQIHKINQKGEKMKKMQGMTSLLSSIDPHKICQIGEEVKLHEKQIGKLQKWILGLQKIVKQRNNQKPQVQVNHGQNTDLIQKTIKEYMSNMDFDARTKKTQKELQQLKKKNDIYSELEKKIYHLSKDIDVNAINKELKKKADEQTTRMDSKIMSGKIQQLFEFYKQLRKEIQEKRKVINNKSELQNASLTTKRLMSANCISCNPTVNRRNNFSKTNKLQMSLDYGIGSGIGSGIESHKNTVYSRLAK